MNCFYADANNQPHGHCELTQLAKKCGKTRKEINVWSFCVIRPLVSRGSIAVAVVQRVQLKARNRQATLLSEFHRFVGSETGLTCQTDVREHGHNTFGGNQL